MGAQPRSPHPHFTASWPGLALQERGLSFGGVERCSEEEP